jgi:hypothetical protein
VFSWTEIEVEKVLQAPKWVVEISAWRQEPGNLMRRRMRATVAASIDCPPLAIVGTHGPNYWGFSFLIVSQSVRRFDRKEVGHRNPDGTEVAGPHKHTWDETHFDRVAYVPADIDFDDVNNGFTDFLAECRISLGGCSYQPLMLL